MKTYSQAKDLKSIAAEISRQAAAGECRQYTDYHYSPSNRAEFAIGTLKLRCTDSPEAIQRLIQRYDKTAGKVKPIVSKAFKWCALAIAKNDIRAALYYVYVTHEWLTGCDGHRIHRMPNAENLAPGYYLKNGTRERDDITADLAYPDLNRVMPGSAECDPVDVESLIYSNEYTYRGVTRELAIASYAVPGKSPITVNRKYLDDALAGLPQAWILAQCTDKLRIDSKISGGIAVMMGLRCES